MHAVYVTSQVTFVDEPLFTEVTLAGPLVHRQVEQLVRDQVPFHGKGLATSCARELVLGVIQHVALK